MNTVEIYLKNSGSTALINVDFRIFQNSYRNKLIDIYVPKELLNSNGGMYMNAVKIGAILTSATGERITTTGYYGDYIEDKTVLGVDYALYRLLMPRAFTTEVGEQTLVINVVQVNVNNYELQEVDENTEGTYYTKDGDVYTQVSLPQDYQVGVNYYKKVPLVIEITTSQTCHITVLESAYLDEDEPIDATQLESVNARLDTAEQDIDVLQGQMYDLIKENGRLEIDEARINANRDAITEIQNTFISGENYIGTLKLSATSSFNPFDSNGNVLPVIKQALTSYVQSIKGRNPERNDTVILVALISGGTDKNYKMIFGSTWTGYEIPPMELASNGTAGLVSGTYGVANYDVLVDIDGGDIKTIYVKDDKTSTYKNLYLFLNDLQDEADATQSNLTTLSSGLTNGTVVVKKAYQDGNGNNIVDTYMTQNAGATKQYVKDYALPKVFNDIYYITANGYTIVVPTDINPQFIVTTSAIGETQAFQLVRDTTAQYELSSKNSYQNKIYLTSDHNCDIILRLETEAYVNGAWVDLRTELSNTISLVANEIQNVNFGSAFLDLGDTVLSIVEGDKIRQTLTIITEHSQQTTFEIYSNSTYPSTFALETTSITQLVQAGEIGQERVYEAVGTLDNGTITFELPVNAVINLETEAEFKLSYVGTPSATDEMVLVLGQENYRLVTPSNLLSGNATVGNMESVANYTQSGTKYWIFKGFIELQGSDTIVRVDTLDLSTKQDITLSGTSDPTTSTVGTVNQLYRNTTSNSIFICTAVTAQGTDPETYTYTWNEIGGGKLYAHNILIYQNAFLSIYVQIINTTSTAFTYNDIAKYLYDGGYRTNVRLYNCSINSVISPVIGGLYATSTTSISYTGLTLGGTSNTTSITINNTNYTLLNSNTKIDKNTYTVNSTSSITDTVVQL